MAELFSATKKNIFDDNELDENSVVKDSLTTASDGKGYTTKLYSLDAISAVDYRRRKQPTSKMRQIHRIYISISSNGLGLLK